MIILKDNVPEQNWQQAPAAIEVAAFWLVDVAPNRNVINIEHLIFYFHSYLVRAFK